MYDEIKFQELSPYYVWADDRKNWQVKMTLASSIRKRGGQVRGYRLFHLQEIDTGQYEILRRWCRNHPRYIYCGDRYFDLHNEDGRSYNRSNVMVAAPKEITGKLFEEIEKIQWKKYSVSTSTKEIARFHHGLRGLAEEFFKDHDGDWDEARVNVFHFGIESSSPRQGGYFMQDHVMVQTTNEELAIYMRLVL